MGTRQTFEEALDTLEPRKVDAILVLRNWDKEENAERVEMGVDLLRKGWSAIMLLLNDENTKLESQKAIDILLSLRLNSLMLVTHSYHAPRAYLTFIQTFKGSDTKIYIKSIPSGIELGERQKIAQYQGIGDCATYEEGIAYITWLTTNSILH